MSQRFTLGAVRHKSGRHYHHFGISPGLCCLYGDRPEDIEPVTLEICEDQRVPSHQEETNGDEWPGTYWGWRDRQGRWSMIYTAFFLLNMCFPGGVQLSQEHGEGEFFRLRQVPSPERG